MDEGLHFIRFSSIGTLVRVSPEHCPKRLAPGNNTSAPGCPAAACQHPARIVRIIGRYVVIKGAMAEKAKVCRNDGTVTALQTTQMQRVALRKLSCQLAKELLPLRLDQEAIACRCAIQRCFC